MPVGMPCISAERRDSGAELGMLVRRQFGDLATGRLDGRSRLAIFHDGLLMLKSDRALDGFAHRPLQVRRPGVELWAIEENRP